MLLVESGPLNQGGKAQLMRHIRSRSGANGGSLTEVLKQGKIADVDSIEDAVLSWL